MSVQELRPSPPPAPPRAGAPPYLILPWSTARWVGPVMMLAFAVAIGIGIANGRGRPAIPAALFVIVGAVTGAAFVVRARHLRLWREGEPCPGELTRSWTSSSGSGSSRTVRRYVEYHYVHEGQRFAGQYQAIAEWKLGLIWVVCDRAQPERSIPCLERD